MKSFKELIAWQKAMALTRKIYAISQKFPRDELYGLTSQLRRCAVSIPANIAEGYGRYSPQDNRRFLRIPMVHCMNCKHKWNSPMILVI